MSRGGFALAVLAVVVLAGCGTGTQTSGPVPAASKAGNLKKALESCRVRSMDALCGTLSVPEDRSKPNGRRLDLKLAVIPATDPSPLPDPFVLLAGGPGGAATDALGWAATTYAGIHRTRDILLVDQRGTGGANRLALPPAPDWSSLPADEQAARAKAWFAEQFAALDADPAMYTTSVAMDDLDDVRAALGYEKINLWGASYGATAAQYYMKQHGGHLRTVVLDGSTLLDVPIFALTAKNTARSLDGVFARCEAEATCRTAFPNVRREFDALLAALITKPAQVADPATGAMVMIDAATIGSGIQTLLLTADGAARIPLLVHLASTGNWLAVLQASHSATASGERLVMDLEIRCSEAWARWDLGELRTLSAGSWQLPFQVAAAERQQATCAFVPKGRVPADDGDAPRSDVPVLLTVGELDPQDPPANIAKASTYMPNSLTVVVPGQGHTVSHLGCVPGIVDAFVAAGTQKNLDTSCIAAGGADVPPFLTTLP